MSTDRGRAVVVGGGLAGLAAAVRLAVLGRPVLLLEAGAQLGGRARTTRHDGYRLGLGPRALYRRTARLLGGLGVPVAGGTPDVADGLALLGGELHPGYAAPGALLRTGLLTVRERLAVARLLLGARGGDKLAGIDGGQWLADRLPSDRARQAAYALLRISSYAGRPEQLGADALAGHFAEVRSGGVRYVDGGWQSITEALLARARALGVEVRTGCRVAAVEAGPRPYVKSADGSGVRAASVVLAGLAPQDAAQLLDRPALAEGAGRPLHTACLDLALSRLPDPRRTLVYGVDEPLYLSVFSTAARLAPPDGAVLHLVRYDDGAALPAAEVRARLEGLLDSCQPGWREHVVHQRFLPRISTMSARPQARLGGLAGRQGAVLPDRPGVFLAGDWVGPTGLLADAAVTSACHAADLAARHGS